MKLPLPLYGQLTPEPKRALPLRPILFGFAVNTIFYAMTLWLLIGGPFVLRRLIRVKRGLCPACGYDLRHGEHDACPECGKPVTRPKQVQRVPRPPPPSGRGKMPPSGFDQWRWTPPSSHVV